MSKRATMALITAVQAAPMALTMAMRQLPMVRSTDWICASGSAGDGQVKGKVDIRKILRHPL